MNPSFSQVYNSKTKFLQSYIDHILTYKERGNFVRDVLFRAWRVWRILGENGRKYIAPRDRLRWDRQIHGKIYFERVRKHLDAHFTAQEMTIILAEKERLTELRRTEEKAKEDECYRRASVRQRTRKLLFVEISVMREMGYRILDIEQELGLSPGKYTTIVKREKWRSQKREIGYLLEVLEGLEALKV